MVKVYGVSVRFRNVNGMVSSNEYFYRAAIEGLVEGDVVVVQARDHYQVAIVVGVTAMPDDAASKWVISKVDTTYAETLNEKMRAVERARELLQQKYERAAKRRLFADLAKDDPEVQAAMDLLESVGEF